MDLCHIFLMKSVLFVEFYRTIWWKRLRAKYCNKTLLAVIVKAKNVIEMGQIYFLFGYLHLCYSHLPRFDTFKRQQHFSTAFFKFVKNTAAKTLFGDISESQCPDASKKKYTLTFCSCHEASS